MNTMNNLEEIKKEYFRYKEILSKVADGDDYSMEAVVLRQVWDIESLERMRTYVANWEDQGIKLTFKRGD